MNTHLLKPAASAVAALCSVALALSVTSVSPVASAPSQVPQKETIDGIRNFTKVDATTGCAGATDPKALAEVAKRGYKSVLNLREATEKGAEIDASKAAAETAGLKYIHLPFNSSKPDPAVADAFIKIVTDKANQPIYIHCGGAVRVSGLWMAKRILVDKWPEEKALAEANEIGPPSETMKQFALAYVKSKR
jgi:uncharacterized protein (TIGR01244 family)